MRRLTFGPIEAPPSDVLVAGMPARYRHLVEALLREVQDATGPARKRMQVKLKEVKQELRRRMHRPIPEQGAYLGAVVRGHVRYYGVPLNSTALGAFHMAIARLWCRLLRRRSQRHRLPWRRMKKYIQRWLPPARICHPYPFDRFAVTTQGRSRMR